jgi:hypothetical protein
VGEVSERWAAVAVLWRDHVDAAVPAGLRGAEPEGDLVLLDADLAGCVSVWRGNGGRLDAERHRIVLACAADLDRVLPGITDPEERRYLLRLRRPAELTTAPQGRRVGHACVGPCRGE